MKNTLRSLIMSGIELKKNENKRKQNFKLIACLLCSNLLLLLLFSFLGNESQAETLINKKTRIFHLEHQRLKLPLTLNVAYTPDDSEIPVSLYSANKKLIISKAYLHPFDQQETNTNFKMDTAEQVFLVEIPNEQIKKLIDHQGENLSAYPVFTPAKSTNITSNPGENYEISF